MILVLRNTVDNSEKIFKLNNVEDFDYFFKMFPQTYEIALGSDGIEDAARKIADYLSKNSRCEAWVADTSMIKAEIERAETETNPKGSKPKRLKLSSGFSERFDQWVQKRIAEDRHLIHRDSTYVADPGRLREPALDYVPEKGILGKIRDAIKKVKDRKK